MRFKFKRQNGDIFKINIYPPIPQALGNVIPSALGGIPHFIQAHFSSSPNQRPLCSGVPKGSSHTVLLIKSKHSGMSLSIDIHSPEHKYDALPELPSPAFSIASDDPMWECPNPPAKKRKGAKDDEKKFRISSKNVFLTFSKLTEEISNETLHERIKERFPALSYIITCKEKHLNGLWHYHMVLHNPNKFDARREDYFNFICGKQGNFQSCRDVLACVVYCKKDNEFLEYGIMPLEKKESSYALALQAKNVKDAMGVVITNCPRDYALHGMQIEQNISNLLTKQDDYVSKYDINTFRPTYAMEEWMRQLGKDKDRFRMLMIISPPNYGKTQWARALGKHLFFRTNVDWSLLRTIQKEEIKYIVFDDVPWEWIKDKKAITMGMGECIVTDKYVRKMKVNVNVPSIFLCNDYPVLDAYYRDQVDVVELEEKLY